MIESHEWDAADRAALAEGEDYDCRQDEAYGEACDQASAKALADSRLTTSAPILFGIHCPEESSVTPLE